MSRFQALTNKPLAEELEMLRVRLGLTARQKADLLREMVAISAWVIQQAEQGRTVEARRGETVEPFLHPAIERLRAETCRPLGGGLVLTDEEIRRLAAVLDRVEKPPRALLRALANLARPRRRPPKLRWKRAAA